MPLAGLFEPDMWHAVYSTLANAEEVHPEPVAVNSGMFRQHLIDTGFY
jgi:hypothetical protein